MANTKSATAVRVTPQVGMKQEAPQVLLAAIRKVLCGQVYVSEKMGATLLQRMVGGKKSTGDLPMDRLTDREVEVFKMIGAGMSVKEIAGCQIDLPHVRRWSSVRKRF